MPGDDDIRDEARVEIGEAIDWYATQSFTAAERLVNELTTLIDSLKRMPERGTKHPDGTRRVLLGSFPYAVIYITSPAFQVIAVAHTSRKPGYWRKRL